MACISKTGDQPQNGQSSQRRTRSAHQWTGPAHQWTWSTAHQWTGPDHQWTGSTAHQWRGWIRLIVGFQPLMVISPTAIWIRWCMQEYSCELMWTCLVWAERSTPDTFWVPSHRFNSATCEQKWITQTIYTDSGPPSRLPNSLMPSAQLRSANLPFFTSLVWRCRA